MLQLDMSPQNNYTRYGQKGTLDAQDGGEDACGIAQLRVLFPTCIAGNHVLISDPSFGTQSMINHHPIFVKFQNQYKPRKRSRLCPTRTMPAYPSAQYQGKL